MKRLFNYIRYWLKITPSWRRCKHASCWDGSNAQRRLMNILSPYFSPEKFREYVAWMKQRGCDTAHVFFANKGDGEGAGYYATDNPSLTRERIKYLRLHGFAIVAWLMADDSRQYAETMFKHADVYVKGLRAAGLFDHVSMVCLGLEMDEYGTAAQWAGVAQAVRDNLPKMKIATHHTSGKYTFAGLGEVVCGQLDPKTASPNNIRQQINKIKSMGKAAIGFEYSRHADRERAQAALDAGAIGVGNW